MKQINEILNTIAPLDIKAAIGLKDGEGAAIKEKHLVITVVDEIKKVAESLGYGFCTKDGLPYLYNGMYWQQITTYDLKQFLRYSASKIGIDKYTAEYHCFSESLSKQFYVSMAILREHEEDVIKINLQNGTFIFGNKKELCSFKKKDYLTYQLPFEYEPNASAPMFEQYLNKVLPDKSCQNILAEYIGYIFTNNHKQEKCLVLLGSGANGKSVFFEIICALLGRENVTNFTLRELDNPNARAMIYNKLLNYSSEMDAGGIKRDTFKKLVSGEALQAKLLYKDVHLITNYAKLMFNSNDLPKDVEYNNAYFRRWLIIPFNQTIPPEEQDKNLASKIITTELPGVFNWVLAGLQRLTEQGKFSESELINNTLDEYIEDTDSVRQFIKLNNYVPGDRNTEGLLNFYKSYTSFCSENGFRPPSISNFRKRIEGQSFLIKRTRDSNKVYFNYLLHEEAPEAVNKFAFADDEYEYDGNPFDAD